MIRPLIELAGGGSLHDAMVGWRREIHANPELAFAEHRTADLVARVLGDLGLAIDRGLGGTGVVGTLEGRGPGGAIALRADMDALPLEEKTDVPYRSRVPGRMHACGHDGHVAMLLGAARHLAATRAFAGKVHFVFQPAEENEGGGRVMVADGLLERFPVSAIFGLHNWPGLPAGSFAVHDGPVMAAFDIFEITVRGRGGHGAMPHLAIDPVVAAAQMVLALQTVVSRNVSPVESAVVSVTDVKAGHTWNVIPDEVRLRGTTRSFRPEVRDLVQAAVRRVVEGMASATGAGVEIRHERRYPATINTKTEADLAASAALDVAGAAGLRRDLPPSMASEDFAYMLEQRPGCYAWIGNGPAEAHSGLHGSGYDFNDAILSCGAAYWVRVATRALS